MTVRIVYEVEPCERCGGCGEFSYNQTDGSRCYGCNGTGKQLTRCAKRARRAVDDFMRAHYSTRVEDLMPGDQIREYNGWNTVVSPPELSSSCALDKETGYWVPFVDIRCRRMTFGKTPGSLIEVRPTGKQFRAEVVPFAAQFAGVSIERPTAH